MICCCRGPEPTDLDARFYISNSSSFDSCRSIVEEFLWLKLCKPFMLSVCCLSPIVTCRVCAYASACNITYAHSCAHTRVRHTRMQSLHIKHSTYIIDTLHISMCKHISTLCIFPHVYIDQHSAYCHALLADVYGNYA
jgi:hypothetical protein